MSTVRLRRLHADHAALVRLAQLHPRISIVQASGSPPERYQIQFRVRSLRNRDAQIEFVSDHLVEITLPQAYPRTPPLCRMLTPVFHPNIAPHAICIGDHWSPGETLPSLVVRIAEMLAYQSYNTRSPLNGEAARWAQQNLGSLPLDPANMTIEDAAHPSAGPVAAAAASAAPPPTTTTAAGPAPAPTPVEIACAACGARLRVTPPVGAARVRCPRCRELTTIPPADARNARP